MFNARPVSQIQIIAKPVPTLPIEILVIIACVEVHISKMEQTNYVENAPINA